jgi:hypothetical protein
MGRQEEPITLEALVERRLAEAGQCQVDGCGQTARNERGADGVLRSSPYCRMHEKRLERGVPLDKPKALHYQSRRERCVAACIAVADADSDADFFRAWMRALAAFRHYDGRGPAK